MFVAFGTFILPNLILSLISISCSTGLNKKFVHVILDYPASWMLPIITYFVIGPYKPNCFSQIDKTRFLGLSICCSGINILLTVIMYAAAFSYVEFNYFLVAWGPVFIVGIVLNIMYLYDKKCCCSKFCCQDHVVTAHVINVCRDNLEIIKVDNDLL